MRKTKQLICIQNFPGFYCSWIDQMLDSELESFVCNETNERQEDTAKDLRLDQNTISEIAFDCMTWRDAFEPIACDWLAALNYGLSDNLGFKVRLVFESVSSPREYNFETDRLFAYITRRTIKRLFAISAADGHETLRDTIAARFTSRSGFVSHYTSSLAEWLEKPLFEWDHNELGTLLDAAIALRGIESDIEDSQREWLCNGAWGHFESAMDFPKYDRAIADARQDLINEMDPDYAPPAPRCPYTPDMFEARA